MITTYSHVTLLFLLTVNNDTFRYFFDAGVNYTLGKESHTAPVYKITSFVEIQDVPIFYKPIVETKVLNDYFNIFVYNFTLEVF